MSGTLAARSLPPGLDYTPAGAWDELADASTVREPYAPLAQVLAGADLAGAARRIAAKLAADGVAFGGGAAARAFVVDPVPRVVAAAEWSLLERGVAQRARALAAFVADVYGERAIVAAGLLPARVIDSAAGFEPALAGQPVGVAGFVAGLDLVRGADGVLAVLEDNVRTPSGIAYAHAARMARERFLDTGVDALPTGPAFTMLGEALRAAAPAGPDDAHVVLLSDGPSNSAWYEHGAIAGRLGLPLIGPGDLERRPDGLWHDDGGRNRRIDVIYRRTDEDRLRDERGRPTWLEAALLGPVLGGTLAVVNPLGSGVADDKVAHAHVEEMVRFYLVEEPLLASVATYDLGDEAQRATVLGSLGDFVVKPRHGLGGDGVSICSELDADGRRAVADAIESRPNRWVAQERVAISTHPTLCEGRLEPRHVDLRPFAIGGGAGARTAPAALTRVALARGSMVVNSCAGGGAKDTLVPA